MSKSNPFSDIRMMKWVTRLLSFQIDGRLNNGYSFPPYLIHITPTSLCNLRCKWGETGNYYNKDSDLLKETMNIEEFERTNRESSGSLSKEMFYRFAQDAVDCIITHSTALAKA